MYIKNEEKDLLTQELRVLIANKTASASETETASLSPSNLSFQSTQKPERSVWIDVFNTHSITIDLEDWNNEAEWDNAIARVSVKTKEEAVQLVCDWLDGHNLGSYAGLNMDYKIVRKQIK